MREIIATEYDSSTHLDENLLYKHGLIDQVTLSKNLTYLWGRDSDMFPLLTATQGQNAFKSITPKELDDTQYTWPVMGRTKWTTKVVALADTGLATPGLGGAEFDVIFEDNWIHYQYSAFSPDQLSQVRFQSEPKKVGEKRYRVTVKLITADLTAYVALTNFVAGQAWAMGPTSVAGQLSDGTTSNRMVPGKLMNQFGWQRYSKVITGNIANKVVNVEVDIEGGGKTNLWMPIEMKQWEVERRVLDEIDLWTSEYNRTTTGIITTTDPETGLPIPKGAGVKQIIKTAGNYDTFSVLTKAKFDSTARTVFGNRIESNTPMEIVLYTGLGGAEMFHTMLMGEAAEYVVAVGSKVVTGDTYMKFGAYFNKYQMIDGRVITVRPCKMFDHGPLAQQDRENGRMYNGYPLYSYNLVFIDHSLDEGGERNVQLVAEKGREEIAGIYVGLTNIPAAWKAVMKREQGQLSTTKDKASYEVMTSRGINLKNSTTSFWLEMSL